MSGFKKQTTQPLSQQTMSESEFENGGRADTNREHKAFYENHASKTHTGKNNTNKPLNESAKKEKDSTKKLQLQTKTESKKTESKNKDNKVFSVLLPTDLIERLKRYQNSENAKRIETQTYIVTQALNAWLDNKGFEK